MPHVIIGGNATRVKRQVNCFIPLAGYSLCLAGVLYFKCLNLKGLHVKSQPSVSHVQLFNRLFKGGAQAGFSDFTQHFKRYVFLLCTDSLINSDYKGVAVIFAELNRSYEHVVIADTAKRYAVIKRTLVSVVSGNAHVRVGVDFAVFLGRVLKTVFVAVNGKGKYIPSDVLKVLSCFLCESTGRGVYAGKPQSIVTRLIPAVFAV